MAQERIDNTGEDGQGLTGSEAKASWKENLRLPSRDILIGGIWIEIDQAKEGEKPFRIIDGKIHMDEGRLTSEKEDVKKALFGSIKEGDKEIFTRMTKGLEKTGDEDLAKLYKKLKSAFRAKDFEPLLKLKSINVDMLTNGIAERNLIREALKPKIKKLPFVFYDKYGKLLDNENEVDFIFVKDKGDKYKIVIGSRKGIGSIELPDDLENDQYQPALEGMDIDNVTDSRIIPLRPAKDGSDPLISTMEIRMGPIDIVEQASKEESRAQAEKAQQKKQDQQFQAPTYPGSQYTPPSPQPPRRSSEGGGYGYASVSR